MESTAPADSLVFVVDDDRQSNIDIECLARALL